ncbi:MAG: putative porin [Planctomycetes bacterium]|nr:putative porin [Planctomycetota bacterium]
MRAWILIATFLSGLATAARAQDAPPQSYRFELSGSWMLTSTDSSPDIDINEFAVGGMYFLAPVSLANHPWNEAAFLEHAKGIMAGVQWTKFEVGPFSADGPSIGAGFLYADKEEPIAAQFSVRYGTLDGDMGIDVDRIGLSGWVGYWLRQNALVGFAIDHEETDVSGLLDIKQTRYGAFGKTVYDLGGGRAINAEARVGLASVDAGASADTNFEIGLEGDYYFTPRFSVGAALNLSVGDAVSREGLTYGVRGSAWLSPRVSVGVELSSFRASDSQGADIDTAGAYLTVRL